MSKLSRVVFCNPLQLVSLSWMHFTVFTIHFIISIALDAQDALALGTVFFPPS